ncbi:MAG TPA: glycosyltransferase family 4 protein [Pseudolabrys sp.]|nr:glycosyltransferase family 4 protein [Pseudolabrys sp.]
MSQNQAVFYGTNSASAVSEALRAEHTRFAEGGLKMLLVLSFGRSLKNWREEGSLKREMAVYLRYLEVGWVSDLYIYSYLCGDNLAGLNIPDHLAGKVHVLQPQKPIRSRLGLVARSLDLRAIRAAVRNGITIVKTNQISGSWVAMIAMLFGAHVLARGGYILSRRFKMNKQRIRYAVAILLEWLLFNTARRISVTTDGAAAEARRRMIGRRDRVFVNPTYVDLELFNGDVLQKTENEAVLFVGRFEPEKGVLELFDACEKAGVPLHLAGRGTLIADVLARVGRGGVRHQYLGHLDNEGIANLFRRYKYYVIPSKREGMPKSLIEAMGCEMVCIGTPIPGIRELISDNETGYLAQDTTTRALADAIVRARQDPRAVEIARAARVFALNHHTIDAYVDRERREWERR